MSPGREGGREGVAAGTKREEKEGGEEEAEGKETKIKKKIQKIKPLREGGD